MINKQRILERSKNKCELCGDNLEVIYNIRTKSIDINENDPVYSLLGLCKKCAKTLMSGKPVKSNHSIKIIVFLNKDGSHSVRTVDGKISDNKIKEQLKDFNNYTIEGPFNLTDVVSESKLKYYLGKK